jgi:hypothetical protein
VPEGWKLVLVPDELAGDEPDWNEVRHQAEVAYGLKVGDVTMPILIREVRRWIAQKWAAPAAPAPVPAGLTYEQAEKLADHYAGLSQEDYDYLDERLCDRNWKPHKWVVEAVMAASRAAPAAPALQPMAVPQSGPCDHDYASGHGEGYAEGWNAAIEASRGAAPAAPASAWQPIETAPKDRFVLVASTSGYRGTPLRIEAAEWSDDYQAWMTHSHDRFTDGGSDAAWWMLLPALPAIAASKGESK